MIEQKYELPNGNIFIWLGNQPIHGCENVLILSSGDVLFLKTMRREQSEKLRWDIAIMDRKEFLREHKWPNNESGNGLYLELQVIYS